MAKMPMHEMPDGSMMKGRKMRSVRHIGFEAAARRAGHGDVEKGARIVAAASRGASAAAKKRNPRLARVRGGRES